MSNQSGSDKMQDRVNIAGAGPAGLAAAITLARAGKQVVVHEARPHVGYRFGRDFQGLENWTSERDVLEVLNAHGITTGFRHRPCSHGSAFDAWGQEYPIRNDTPLFYLVERGPNPGSLDSALLDQARELGVEVRFNSRVTRLTDPGILAIGPKAADAIAVGYHFETDMADGFWVICDDNLAPKGYAYLLIWAGWGTVKSCMFTGFKQEQIYVQRTVAAFERLLGLKMKNPQRHGGVGNFRIPRRAYFGTRPMAGEQAGFQDTLWGFGMRHAILSGVLAANSMLEQTDYDTLWQNEFGDQLKVSIVNRALFGLLGNRGYRWFLRRQARQTDVRAFLRRQYHSSLLKWLLIPWARLYFKSALKDESCNHISCECVWCRCGGD